MAVRSATTETIGHIGALIMLMALSISVGGMIERSGLMSVVPAEMGSIWMALTIFMFMMVFIGMVMDPFGAVILVSATVAPIAYSNGIHPVHFWMIVITAFELGYLSPPVALNQLLARQVVGEAEMDKAAEDTKHKPFYYRYERWLLPVYTLFIGLLIVTYGGQALINNADNLKPVSHFLGLDQLRPACLINLRHLPWSLHPLRYLRPQILQRMQCWILHCPRQTICWEPSLLRWVMLQGWLQLHLSQHRLARVQLSFKLR